VAGYHVEIAATALDALQRGHALRPDALIVPLALPGADGGDGPGLADRIGSAGPRVHALAVVILVPDDGGPPRSAGAVTAGTVFCNLPCEPAALVAMVARQLAARRLQGGHRP